MIQAAETSHQSGGNNGYNLSSSGDLKRSPALSLGGLSAKVIGVFATAIVLLSTFGCGKSNANKANEVRDKLNKKAGISSVVKTSETDPDKRIISALNEDQQKLALRYIEAWLKTFTKINTKNIDFEKFNNQITKRRDATGGPETVTDFDEIILVDRKGEPVNLNAVRISNPDEGLEAGILRCRVQFFARNVVLLEKEGENGGNSAVLWNIAFSRCFKKDDEGYERYANESQVPFRMVIGRELTQMSNYQVVVFNDPFDPTQKASALVNISRLQNKDEPVITKSR